MNYFNPNLSVDQIKSLYFKLARENHPDLGGSEDVTLDQIRAKYGSQTNLKEQPSLT